jgi:hypothetical protein
MSGVSLKLKWSPILGPRIAKSKIVLSVLIAGLGSFSRKDISYAAKVAAWYTLAGV